MGEPAFNKALPSFNPSSDFDFSSPNKILCRMQSGVLSDFRLSLFLSPQKEPLPSLAKYVESLKKQLQNSWTGKAFLYFTPLSVI
jgi:hypothetical protein